jgi:hypothetical protein
MTHEVRAFNIRQDSGVYYLKTSFLLTPNHGSTSSLFIGRSDHGRSVILEVVQPRRARSCVVGKAPRVPGRLGPET